MPIRMLIVDDSAETLDVLRLHYSQCSEITVAATARTGADALAYCEQTQVDLVSIDISLSCEDGFQLCRRIRRQYPSVFITMCSLIDDDSSHKLAYEVGADYFLSKPLRFADIDGLVYAFRHRREAASRTAPASRVDELEESLIALLHASE